MKKTVLLLVLCILFSQLSIMEVKSEVLYQSDASTEFVLNGADEADPVFFTDSRFLKRLIVEGVDSNEDGLVSYAEAANVKELNIGIENHCYLTPDMITDLTGIEAFVNLEVLHVYGNLLSRLDVSNAPNLRVLTCNMNMISELDVSQNPLLEVLDCSWNRLSEIDVTANTYLKKLVSGHNQYESIDLSKNLELTYLNCNSYTSKEQAMCANLRPSPVGCAALCNLDLSNNINLEVLFVCGKGFQTLDLSNNKNLKVLYLYGFRYDCPINIPWSDAVLHPGDRPDFPEWVYVVEIACANTVLYTCVEHKGGENLAVSVDKNMIDQIRIYPNPAVDFINIEGAGAESSTVNIHSLSGQILYSEIFEGGSHSFDVSMYSKGMYLLTIKTGNHAMTKKILLK